LIVTKIMGVRDHTAPSTSASSTRYYALSYVSPNYKKKLAKEAFEELKEELNVMRKKGWINRHSTFDDIAMKQFTVST
jgi:hypothetical protein